MRTRFHKIVVSALVLCVAFSARAAVVLSEIMYDPAGDEATDEFVELYNNSALPVQLQGWTISDGATEDTLADAGQGLLAAPNQFILIIDPDYVESGSTTYDGLVPESALIVTISNNTFGSRGLSNSSPETISIRNATGSLVAQYTYSIENESGHSDEKIRLAAPDDSSNWHSSLEVNGTPGRRNSVTPPDRDLSIVLMRATPDYPLANSNYELEVVIVNTGLQSLSSTVVIHADSSDGAVYVLDSLETTLVQPADTTVLSPIVRMPSSGIHELLAELTVLDDIASNDTLSLLITSDISQNGLLFNEIMSEPLPGRAEWVEFAVFGSTPVSTRGVFISDGNGIADSTKRFGLPELVVLPGSFFVLAADSSVLMENIPLESRLVILDASGFTLNNSGDSLVLYNSNGDVLERVDYRGNWGNGEAGVSLERLSSEIPTNEEQNWKSSVDPTGSTPGRMNSRSISSAHSQTTLSVAPSPFTPNDDGKDDVAEIRYQLEQPGHAVSVKIFDIRGREINRLTVSNSASSGVLLWDGRKSNGTTAPTARYVVLLEAENDNGSNSTARTTVILARPK